MIMIQTPYQQSMIMHDVILMENNVLPNQIKNNYVYSMIFEIVAFFLATVYTGCPPKKRNGRVLGLRSIQTDIRLTLLDKIKT